MANANAVFVGDGSLLIQCAEIHRHAGNKVQAVVSGNTANLDWAAANGLRAVRMEGPWEQQLGDTAFDYLFSVANLRVLPASVVARARKLAVNFHDALLPRYAGLNATCWALMAQERRHGVTWHEMTAGIDAGRIVRQVSFELSPAETALSLNARCYEAGLAAFTAIVQDIARGELPLAAQSGECQYFGRHRRPDALATLDFQRPARETAALVRALDFGPYANPLARPKVRHPGGLLLVRTAAVFEGAASAAPGTVLAIDGDAMRVATADGELLLGGCTDLYGRPGTQALVVGRVLPALDAELQSRLAAQSTALAKGEVFWTAALHSLAPVELPYPRRVGAPRAERLCLTLDAAKGSATVAAFFAWLSALTGQEKVSVLYSDSTLTGQAQGIEAWASPWVPLTLQTAPQAAAADTAASAEVQIAKCRAAGPMTRDLALRLGDKPPAVAAVGRVAISLEAGAALDDCELLLRADASGHGLELVVDPSAFSPGTAQVMAGQLSAYLQAFSQAQGRVAGIALLAPHELNALAAINATAMPFDSDTCVHQALAARAAHAPHEEALRGQGQRLTYAQLEAQSTALAHRLVERGVKAGDIVGLCLERTPTLVVAALAVMKAGAAYLPLDPEYPRDRIRFMVEDSAAPLVLASAATTAAMGLPVDKVLLLDAAAVATAMPAPALPAPDASRPAYVIYTSGSTGRPKGVVVTHRNAMNFFAGMDLRVAHEPGARWLAVTSLSFDISVLELFWTLTRGIGVVLYADTGQSAGKAPAFSLFYFASDDANDPQDRYRLLIEGAKYADREGFHAIWTPERHFHAFGGLYPNPSVTSAAIAAMTTRLQIRAGSCVVPLHHPVRVAEEWAFVDNISQGRVGISFASGWQPNDFVLAPETFAKRQDEMISRMDIVRRLWRGESVAFPGPKGDLIETRTLPRPVQPELPVWITAAGNPKTFEQAGMLGCRLLTHLLGQNIDDVAEKLRLYRAAWLKAGHAGQGHVTLMLHTFVGQDEDAVRETAREPMKSYLRSSIDLIKQAAWSFPAFVERGAARGKSPVEVMESEPLSEQDMDALLDHAFNRYYKSSALIGTPERCMGLVDKLKGAGVDEIACLIDFGIATDTVLAHLADLKQLMEAARRPSVTARRVSVAEEILQHGVTHLQCTPSMAAMLVADAPGRAALSRLSGLLVGGEALPLELASQLRALVPGALLNMYGPTETTVWSTVCDLAQVGSFVPLGRPIANTSLSIRTPWGAECPALVPGELFIGGEGLSKGYLHRPELTAERFVADAANPAARWYRTGDLVRRLPDGAIEFLGRIDHQVKLRGHRIELGEIESVLLRQEGVAQAVVVAREDALGEKFLAAYVTARPGATLEGAALRQAVAQALPEIMVPRTLLVLPAMPMTPNGKVDRKALPDPHVAAAPRAAVAPGNEMENIIAGIWQDVLGLPAVGTTDNFFDLGGHSLLVVQVQRRLREASGREVPITDMFRLPTIKALAAHLGGNTATTAISDGLSRAQARRVMRTRGMQPAPTA